MTNGMPEQFRPDDILKARGVDPATVPDTDPDPRGFDPVEFRTAQARAALAARVPARFATAVPDHPDVVAWVRAHLNGATTSLLIVGPTGVGKTHQAWGAVRAIVEATARRGRGLRWYATTHPDLNDAMRPKTDNRHVTHLAELINADLLMLDDLGAGKQSEWTGDTLYRLVDHRWAQRLPTIYSTNLNPAQLKELDDRVASRVADARRVPLLGGDRRWLQAS